MPSIIRQGTVYGVPAKLGGLTDVTLSTPTAGQSLVYDATLDTWINGEGGGKVWQGTQAQYDAIANPDPDTTYYITDTSPYTTPTAGVIYYDNTSSGLSANTVQGAIDEVDGKVFYGVCNAEPTVSGNQRIWTVTLNNGDGFALTAGATVYIKFTYEETGTVASTIPYLNVNGTGAKLIYMNYTPGNAGYTPRWREGQVCVFTYDGSKRWFQINPVQSAFLTPYSNSSSGLTATNVQSAINEVNTKTDLITGLANAGRVQVIQGNKRFKATETLLGYTYPYSILIIGYNSLALVHAIKTYLPLSGITKIYGTGSDSCTLNTTTGEITTGTDANRQFTCIMPRNIILVEQTS